MTGRRRTRQARRVIHTLIALCVSAAVLGVLAFGYGPIPALGPALDPGHGVWTSAAGAAVAHSQVLTIQGLAHPVRVSFTSDGVPSIQASDDSDLFLALGYVHATFRLTEMDLERRLAEGRLAQLAGPSAVGSDKFELRLGLLRTAQEEWAAMPRSGPAAQALLAYSRGVNDYLAQVRASHDWPALFSLAGVYPANWTPVDSLLVQGDFTQELDFTTTPLDYALLERSLGAARTMAWFPVLPPDQQSPYDPGPYVKAGIAPLATGSTLTAAAPAGAAAAAAAAAHVPTGPATVPAAEAAIPAAEATAASALLAQVNALPAGAIHRYPDSNAWAANGPAVAGGRSMLAGDPHLLQTIPSVWYQVALSAPGLSVTGVSVPGLPAILLGHNGHIAWSLTNTQNQATLFYTEQTSKSRPGEYFWRGAWRRMRQVRYTIPVRGGGTVRLTVDITVHGPVMTQLGQTTSVDWMGSVPSPDLAVILAINKATDFAQFRSALAGWRAPSQNFVYADDRGNIGAISAGYYPQVRHGDPWLPLPGTGADDVAGVIPYQAVPQVYDPPGHVVATANQRPVAASYPYYIGTTANFFDTGYRASEIYATLRGRSRMTAASFAALQNSVTDPLAVRIVPRLLAALRGQHLSPREQAAARLLAGWNAAMGAGSAAASVWWTFWTDYLSAVFQPWWTAAKVPVRKDRIGLKVSPGQVSLDEDLEAWTLRDPGNAAFTSPRGQHRTAAAVMRSAFSAAVAHLTATLGGAPSSWAWGRLHSRQFSSLTQADALGYGPRSSGADPWTVDTAEGGGMVSRVGPSWRMIVQWTGRGQATAEGVYPGGQSENPASPWYEDLVADWWNGRYLPLPPAGGYASGAIQWVLRPSATAREG
jgi:penicillin amidase